jgi:ribose transport system substrate-binding protein
MEKSMTSRRIWIWGALVLCAVGVIVFREYVYRVEPKPTGTHVVLITGGSGPFWQMVINGAKSSAAEHKAQLQVVVPEQQEGVEEQTKLLLDVDETKVDGLAISPLDAESQTHPINALVRHINVVTFDADAPLSERQYYIGTSNFRAGQLSAELIAEALPQGGAIVVLYANMKKHNMIERAEGFENFWDTHPDTKIKVVGTLIDEGSDDVCRSNIRKAISDHPDLAGIVGMNAQHGPLILEVLEKDSLLGKIKVAAFDEDDRTLKGVADGHIQGTVVQDPYMYGYEAVRKLVELQAGREELVPIVGKGVVNIQCDIVRKNDVADFQKKLDARLKKGTSDPAKKNAAKSESG